MDIPRFLQVFVVQGFVGFFFLYIAIKILKREAKGLNLTLSIFYFFVAFGTILNIVYVNIFDELIVLILHFITYYLFCLSLIFLLIFILVLKKSDKVITLKIRVFLVSLFALLLIVLWFIPDGITINETTAWKPEWSWTFFLSSFIVCTSLAIGPTIFYSIKIYHSFKNEYLKRKWRYFLIGINGFFFLYYGTTFSNTLADPLFRLIWSLLSLPALVSLYFIYHGVAKQL